MHMIKHILSSYTPVFKEIFIVAQTPWLQLQNPCYSNKTGSDPGYIGSLSFKTH